MKKIGFYTAATHILSDYAHYMDGKEWTSINMMTVSEPDLSDIHAFVFDYTTSPLNQSDMSALYEQLMATRIGSQAPLFIFIKEADVMNRMIWYQLGATGVFDQSVKPNEFSLILRNIVTCWDEGTVVPKQEKEGVFQLCPDRLSVLLPNGKECFLTRMEYHLLDYLKEKGQEGSTYEEIYHALWKNSVNGKTYRVANLIFHLRKKIEENPTQPRYIHTIRTVGYRFQLY